MRLFSLCHRFFVFYHKYPFWQMTAKNPKAVYACINMGEAWVPEEIAERSICIDGDIGEVIKKMIDAINF